MNNEYSVIVSLDTIKKSLPKLPSFHCFFDFFQAEIPAEIVWWVWINVRVSPLNYIKYSPFMQNWLDNLYRGLSNYYRRIQIHCILIVLHHHCTICCIWHICHQNTCCYIIWIFHLQHRLHPYMINDYSYSYCQKVKRGRTISCIVQQ